MKRPSELISGIVAGVLGLALIGFTLFIVSGNRGGMPAATTLFFAVVSLGVVGVAFGAYLHSQHDRWEGRVLLHLSTFLVWIGVILGAFSVGLFLLPTAVLATYASGASAGNAERRGGQDKDNDQRQGTKVRTFLGSLAGLTLVMIPLLVFMVAQGFLLLSTSRGSSRGAGPVLTATVSFRTPTPEPTITATP